MCETSYMFQWKVYTVPIVSQFKKYVMIITVDVLLSFFFFILLRVSFLDVLCTCMICFLSLQIGIHISMYPAMLHSIPLATFASLIAPFGGFFASGFKRAFKVKVSNHYCTHFWLSLNIFDSFLGFCWCHSRAWWIDGSVWLSVANGILC